LTGNIQKRKKTIFFITVTKRAYVSTALQCVTFPIYTRRKLNIHCGLKTGPVLHIQVTPTNLAQYK